MKFRIGITEPLFLVAGPCIIESAELTLQIATELVRITTKLGMNFIFKASFDKANRTSHESYRGPGIEAGLKILQEVKQKLAVPILVDVHEIAQVPVVSKVADMLQIPAFLCRQTDLIQAAAKTGKSVNIKKGQFLAPQDMVNVVAKAKAVGNDNITVCERGVSFGYNNLVVDMRSLAIMRQTGCPVMFDATHSVQQPGGLGKATGGNREYIPVLARAAVAAGISGIFMETHPEPDKSPSDAANTFPLARIEELLITLIELDRVTKDHRFLENSI